MKPGRVSIAPCGHSRPSKSERIPQEKNVKFAKPLVLALTLIVATPVLSLAHDYRVGSLAIDQPWARAMPAGAPVAGGYLTITNTGSERSEEHTSELQSLMRISYAVFCLKKQTKTRRLPSVLVLHPRTNYQLVCIRLHT